jgi:4'-phosphopantetheinyl transferase
VVARAQLRIALGRRLGRAPRSLRFMRGPHGKPALVGADGARLHFSQARSGDVCLLALSADGPVGVDVEALSPLPELEPLVAARFAPSEAAAILRRSGEQRLRAFYRCWTRKEACLKATGAGLSAGLAAVVVAVDEHPTVLAAADGPATGWGLRDLDPGPGFAAALAHAPRIAA